MKYNVKTCTDLTCIITVSWCPAGDPVPHRGGDWGHPEEDAGAGHRPAPGATRPQDAADGAAGLYRYNCQPGTLHFVIESTENWMRTYVLWKLLSTFIKDVKTTSVAFLALMQFFVKLIAEVFLGFKTGPTCFLSIRVVLWSCAVVL